MLTRFESNQISSLPALDSTQSPHLCQKSSSMTKKLIKVRQNLQSEVASYIFAAGDVTSIQEEKCASMAFAHADTLIASMRSLAQGASTKLKDYKPRTLMMMISVGPTSALFVVKGRVLMNNGWMLKTKLYVEKKLMK
mmetsp:Transcript_2310/g.8604  ORF Transcript_2310/g.8604 Transcript_2310/m.8604 type:complete len:138 (-) Transcript_2310:2988-3401(-)